MSLHLVSEILTGTPLWVFGLFAYVMWMGARRLGPRVSSIRRIWFVPLLFIVWGLVGLASRPVPAELVALIWGASALAGIALGILGRPRQLLVDRQHGLVRQQGSVLPLVRYALIFGAHYALNVAMHIRPDLRHNLILADIAVSGIGAGYFAGWILSFLRGLARANEADLSSQAAAPTAAALEAAQ